MLTHGRGPYLGVQWAAAEGEYCTHAWLAESGLLLGRGEVQQLRSCGPLHRVLGEGLGSRAWLHLPVAWEEHWPWQAVTPVVEGVLPSPYLSLHNLSLSAEGHTSQ